MVLMIKFQCADYTLRVVFVDHFGAFGIHLCQHLMKICSTFFLDKRLQTGPVSIILLGLGKINVSGHRLNIKAGSPHQNGNMSPGVNLFHGILCHLLETHNVKFFLWHQLIHQVMGNSLHFFWHDLRRANIHIFINLHGICRYDLTANGFCQGNRQPGFSNCSGTGKDNKRFFHNLSCLYNIALSFMKRA